MKLVNQIILSVEEEEFQEVVKKIEQEDINKLYKYVDKRRSIQNIHE